MIQLTKRGTALLGGGAGNDAVRSSEIPPAPEARADDDDVGDPIPSRSKKKSYCLELHMEDRSARRTRKRGQGPSWAYQRLFEGDLNELALSHELGRMCPLELDVAEYAHDVLEALIEEFEPATPLERLLAYQIIWQHGRIARLVQDAANPSNGHIDLVRILYPAVDRAMNVFRRQVLALKELQERGPRSKKRATKQG